MSAGLFISGFKLYGSCWLRSFLPGRHPGAPLTTGRLFFLVGIFPLFLVIQLVHWLGHGLDELFFPGYREVKVTRPVFIAGIPRSGTTFWQRTLALNERSFTTMRAWEALLAPSITYRKMMRCMARCDHALGSPLKRLSQWLIDRIAGDFQDVHEVGVGMPEEDYLTLLPAGGCFLMALAFPFEPRLWELGKFHRLSTEEQDKWLNFYKGNLQKQLYGKDEAIFLLSKNAAFSSWLTRFPDYFPDARYILCIRDPYSALSSQLSSLRSGRQLFAVDSSGEITSERFKELYAGYYRQLAGWVQSLPPESLAIVDMEDLKKSNVHCVRRVLKQLDLPCDPGLERELTRMGHASDTHRSGHRYGAEVWGFDKSQIDALMGESYGAIRSMSANIRNERG
jgi:hypothetical protein